MPNSHSTYDGRRDARHKRAGAAEAREQIAAELERDAEQLRREADECANERSPLLKAQADALADAALRIREGGERPDAGTDEAEEPIR